MVAMIIALGPNEIEIPCMTFATADEARAFITDKIGNRGKLYKEDHWGIEDEGDWDDVAALFFTRHYGGCGAANGYTVREVSHGQVFTHWDLD